MKKQFLSHSQAAQDLWVKAVCIDALGITAGTFLDIGCSHPIALSNTCSLEEHGWRGVMVDVDESALAICKAHRPLPHYIHGDAALLDWKAELTRLQMPPIIDYLSLDVDADTVKVLPGLLDSGFRFRVATVEHDSYRFGPGPKDKLRHLMRTAGYQLIAADVRNAGLPFEDWWAAPELVTPEAVKRFISTGQDGWDIVKFNAP